MATTQAQAAGSSRSLVVGGREYFVSPLTEGQWAEYSAWVTDQWLDTQKRNAKDLDPADRQAILLRAFEVAGRMQLGSPGADTVTETPAGIYRLVWLSLRRRHPDITPEGVAEFINSAELLAAAAARVQEANSMQKKKPPTRPRTSTRAMRRLQR